MRKASLIDVPQLVTLMAEFYTNLPYSLNPGEQLTRSPRCWLTSGWGMSGSLKATPGTWGTW